MEGDESYRSTSAHHGYLKELNYNRYTLRDSQSRILSPGTVLNDSKGIMMAFMFIEYFKETLDKTATLTEWINSDPWVLTAF